MAYAMNTIDWYRQQRSGLVGFGGFNGFGDANTSANRTLVQNSGYWDANWYKIKNPDVVAAGVDPLRHFIESGGTPPERRDPGVNFSTGWYFDHYPDVYAAGANALIHYVNYGMREGRSHWGTASAGGSPAPTWTAPSTPSPTPPPAPSAPPPSPSGPSAIDVYNAAINDYHRAVAAANAHNAPDAISAANQAGTILTGPAKVHAQAGDVSATTNDAAQVKTLADQAEAADRSYVQAQSDAATRAAAEAMAAQTAQALAQAAGNQSAADAAAAALAAAQAAEAAAAAQARQSQPTTILVGQPMAPVASTGISSSTILVVGAGLAALFLLKK